MAQQEMDCSRREQHRNISLGPRLWTEARQVRRSQSVGRCGRSRQQQTLGRVRYTLGTQRWIECVVASVMQGGVNIIAAEQNQGQGRYAPSNDEEAA